MSTALAPVDRTPLAEIKRQIATLLHEGADKDVAAEMYMRALAVRRLADEVMDAFDEQMLPWLKANGGSLTIADQKLFAGVAKTEKVRSLHAALDSALTLCGGDVEVLEGILSANALKPGACEAVFGDEWRREHFEVKRKDKVEVRTINTRYLPKESASEHVQAGRQE